MKNGPILVIAEKLVKVGYYTNLVELIKHIAAKVHEWIGESHAPYLAKSVAIDLYIFLKWLAVAVLWFKGSDSLIAAIITVYLLWGNVFTYFYYHVWDARHSNDISWQRRRFTSLFQSIGFHVFGFAYLYRYFALSHFKWEFAVDGTMFGKDILSLMFSCLNLFGSGSTVAAPTTLMGLFLLTSQIVMTFIFLTLILSNTQINKESK